MVNLMFVLDRKLDSILQELMPLAQQGKVTQFSNNNKDLDKLDSLIEDIYIVVLEYQVCVQLLDANLP